MSQLIAFLTNNFYFVIIIVTLIYTMFFRKSAIERPPNRMPDFDRGGRGRPEGGGEASPNNTRAFDRSPTESHLPPSEQPSPVPVTVARTMRVEQSQQEERRRVRPEATRQASSTSAPSENAYGENAYAVATSSTQLGVPQHLQQTQLKDPNGLRREDLARAVMWSEILGPPRARRPHRR